MPARWRLSTERSHAEISVAYQLVEIDVQHFSVPGRCRQDIVRGGRVANEHHAVACGHAGRHLDESLVLLADLDLSRFNPPALQDGGRR